MALEVLQITMLGKEDFAEPTAMAVTPFLVRPWCVLIEMILAYMGNKRHEV
jgi:hypothetical protein